MIRPPQRSAMGGAVRVSMCLSGGKQAPVRLQNLAIVMLAKSMAVFYSLPLCEV